LEFIIYIAIVGAVLTVGGAMAVNILLGKAKLANIEEVSYSGRFSMEKISTAVSRAESINSPFPSGSFGPALSLKMSDASKNPTIFDTLGGAVRMQEGLGPIIELTSSEVTVSYINFSNISYPNTPGTARIEMRLKSGDFEKTFYTTANIYE